MMFATNGGCRSALAEFKDVKAREYKSNKFDDVKTEGKLEYQPCVPPYGPLASIGV